MHKNKVQQEWQVFQLGHGILNQIWICLKNIAKKRSFSKQAKQYTPTIAHPQKMLGNCFGVMYVGDLYTMCLYNETLD